MVVHDLYVKSGPVPPDKTQPVLIIDSNAVLSSAIAVQRFQAISRRDLQVIERHGGVQNSKLLEGSSVQISGYATTRPRPPQLLCPGVPETRYHRFLYYCNAILLSSVSVRRQRWVPVLTVCRNRCSQLPNPHCVSSLMDPGHTVTTARGGFASLIHHPILSYRVGV